jgi:hypothetical protein
VLADFQQACADLVASPELVQQAREDPSDLLARYELTDLERRRLVAFANAPGIAASCMLYRANRLAPLALNLRELCTALGPRLRPLLDAYWRRFPNTDVHFLAECRRFCAYLQSEAGSGQGLPPAISNRLAEDIALLDLRLEASHTEPDSALSS